MITKDLLDLLVCPENHTPLALADEGLIDRVNRAIARGQIVSRAGGKVETPIDGGLVRQDGQLLYPIVDDIPVLLIDEAIPLEQLSGE